MRKFKIDLTRYTSSPYGLYYWKQSFIGFGKWRYIEAFSIRDEAKAYYEKIKDLPEYL